MKKSDEARTRTQRTKTLITDIKRRGMKREEILKRVDEIFGKRSCHEIENVKTDNKIVERSEEMSKREEQFDTWEQMRREAKRKRVEDRRLNVLWWKNKCFPAHFGSNEDTPDTQETLEFWRSINNKVVTERWREDEAIQEVLRGIRESLGRRC